MAYEVPEDLEEKAAIMREFGRRRAAGEPVSDELYAKQVKAMFESRTMRILMLDRSALSERTTTLQIGRSNITIKGTILTSPSDTVLQRAPGYQGLLMQDVQPQLR